MKSIARAAIVATLLGTAAASTALLAPDAANAAEKLSHSVQKALAAATQALQTKDYATALTDVQQAQAVDDRSDYDNYEINKFLGFIYGQMKNYPAATGPMEAAADSPALPDEDKKDITADAFQLAFASKQYDKAIVYGQRLEAIKAADSNTYLMLAIAYYYSKDSANATKYAQMSIDAAKAAGKEPDENALRIVENSQAQSNDVAGFRKTLEDQAMTYGAPQTWGKLVDLALNTPGIKDTDELYLLRLKINFPEAMRPDDYTGMATIADDEGYATEAYAVLQKAIAAGKITSSSAGQTYAHARNGAAMDARELNSIAVQSAKMKQGEADIKLAEDYWGYGRFADAEVAARRAIAKGGLKDPTGGPMLLGMILTEEGKYDEAIQTLSQINGTQARNATAHVWSLWAQYQKKKAGGAAAPAPATPPAQH